MRERTKIDWTKPIEGMQGQEAKYYETARQPDGLPECGHSVRAGLLLKWLDDFGRDAHGVHRVRNTDPNTTNTDSPQSRWYHADGLDCMHRELVEAVDIMSVGFGSRDDFGIWELPDKIVRAICLKWIDKVYGDDGRS